MLSDPWNDFSNACLKEPESAYAFNVTEEKCKARCLNETTYACMSVNYSPSQLKCRIHVSTRYSSPSLWSQTCAGRKYAERINFGEWIFVDDLCVDSTSDSAIERFTADLDSCQTICSQTINCCYAVYTAGRCILIDVLTIAEMTSSSHDGDCYGVWTRNDINCEFQ